MAGSGGALGADEKDGRLMLPHAPRNTAMAEAIPRLTIVRVLLELTMAFSPNELFGRIHPAAKRKTPAGAIMRQT
jgi:hypothetical protein